MIKELIIKTYPSAVAIRVSFTTIAMYESIIEKYKIKPNFFDIPKLFFHYQVDEKEVGKIRDMLDYLESITTGDEASGKLLMSAKAELSRVRSETNPSTHLLSASTFFHQPKLEASQRPASKDEYIASLLASIDMPWQERGSKGCSDLHAEVKKAIEEKTSLVELRNRYQKEVSQSDSWSRHYSAGDKQALGPFVRKQYFDVIAVLDKLILADSLYPEQESRVEPSVSQR